MKTASVRELRSATAKLMQEKEPVVITNHGKPTSVILNLNGAGELSRVVKRALFKEMMLPFWESLGEVSEKELIDDFKRFQKANRS